MIFGVSDMGVVSVESKRLDIQHRIVARCRGSGKTLRYGADVMSGCVIGIRRGYYANRGTRHMNHCFGTSRCKTLRLLDAVPCQLPTERTGAIDSPGPVSICTYTKPGRMPGFGS